MNDRCKSSLSKSKSFNSEVLFKHNGWSIRSFSDETGVKEVFWGEHETCNAGISGSENNRHCPKCGDILSTEDETILRDALFFLRNTLVEQKEPMSTNEPERYS